MSINFNRPNIFENLSSPIDSDLGYAVGGLSTAWDSVFFGPVRTLPYLSLQHLALQRFVYQYTNNTFSVLHCSKTTQFYNINSIVDVNQINIANDTYIEPLYTVNGKSYPDTQDSEWGPDRIEQTNKIIEKLKHFIKSPTNGEYYFTDGVYSKWVKNGNTYTGPNPPTPKTRSTYRYKIYRYGVCTVTGENQIVSYKIIKVSNTNSIQGVKIRQ